MKLRVFMQVDRHATDGYSVRTEPLEEDGKTCWLDNYPEEYRKLKDIVVETTPDDMRWLAKQGVAACEEREKSAREEFARVQALLAEQRSKYLSLPYYT